MPQKPVRKQPDKHWLDPPDWWKKWKPLRWLAVLTIIGGAASGLWSGVKLVMEPDAHPETEAFLATVKVREQLMSTFNSYDSVEAVTAQLAAGNYPWEHKKNHRMPSPDFPPRDLDTVEVVGYDHLGSKGDLTLKFFNNRLYEAEFSPDKPEGYAAPLRKAYPAFKRDRVGKMELSSGTLRIASNIELAISPVGKGLRTSPYVIWQDQRLIRQRNQWDEAYGSIPYKAQF